jgi:SAM-dependent methyltransferase
MKSQRPICAKLDKEGLWRLKGEIYRPEVMVSLNDLQETALSDFRKAINDGEIKFVLQEQCACGANEPIHFANIDRFGLSVNSYICGSCGLVYTSPVLSSDTLKLFYEKYYHLMHFGSPATPDRALYKKGQGKKIYHILKKWCDHKDLNVLEVGCGSGSVLKEFVREASLDGFQAKGIGVEYSPDYVQCFDAEGLNIEIYSGHINTLVEDLGPFDVVIFSHVFEHLLNLQEELLLLKKFIDEQSLIYIEVPGIFSLKYRYEYDCDYLKYYTFSHIYNFNLTSLVNILNMSGYGLIWGNEQIESVFSIGNQSIDISDNASAVFSYLQQLERNKMFYSNLATNILSEKINEIFNIDTMKSDISYVKSFVDPILSVIPNSILKQIRRLIRNKK